MVCDEPLGGVLDDGTDACAGAVLAGGALEGGAGGVGAETGAAGVEVGGVGDAAVVGFVELGLGAQASSSNLLVARVGAGNEVVFAG